MSEPYPGKIGLVLAGGGARGAYEAGVLSVILPELERLGARPTLYVGTSVGAINAAILASRQHLSAAVQAQELVGLWSGLRRGDIMAPIVARSGPAIIAKFVAQLLAVPNSRVTALLDPSPLWKRLDGWINFDQLYGNIDEGLIDVLAVVATSARSGRTVVFVDSAQKRTFHRSHAVAYAQARMTIKHVGASAAIPALWPAVMVDTPERSRGWYVDGGLRLNAPIKPALDLEADRLVVVAVDSIEGPVMSAETAPCDLDPPDLGDGGLQLLESALVDPLIEDMRTLGSINEFHASASDTALSLYRTVRGKAPYRRIPYVFVGPGKRGAVGELAAEVFSKKFGGLKRLRDPDLYVISEVLGGLTSNHAELLSLLFFDPDFAAALIEMGERDARAWLSESHDSGEEPWQIGPLGTFVRPRQWTAG
jgi:NTE family protein